MYGNYVLKLYLISVLSKKQIEFNIVIIKIYIITNYLKDNRVINMTYLSK